MKIAIIEDEKRTAKDLARTIEAVDPQADIVVMLQSVEEALDYFSKPVELDLIFSDIQLGDGLSFDIFEQTKLNIPIIYCTAFNHYALEAFKTLGIDYLVKPFSKSTVGLALEKFKTIQNAFRPPQESFTDLMSALKKQLQPAQKPSVIIHQKDKIIPLSIEKIALFFIENEMVYAHTFTGERHPVSHKLNDLEVKYSPAFFRANRQFLIHRKAVKDASHYFNRKVLVHLTIPFEEQILVGKVKVSAFLEWLAGG